MTPENKPLYNYQSLDRLLIEVYDPKELGNELDEIMSELVYLSDGEERHTYHHLILRTLRDIFWKLEKLK
jgi:hypothetical protein